MMKNIYLNGLNNITPSGFRWYLLHLCYNNIIPSGLFFEYKKILFLIFKIIGQFQKLHFTSPSPLRESLSRTCFRSLDGVLKNQFW